MTLVHFFQSTLPVPVAAPSVPADPKWDYNPAAISSNTLQWPNAGTAPGHALTLNGTAIVEPNGGPNGTPCVAFANHNCYDGAVDLGISGAAARTHLVIFETAGTNNIELMGWGHSDYNQLYDTMIYGNALIQHFYGYELYSATPVLANEWNAWLVRGAPTSDPTVLNLKRWLNGSLAETLVAPDTGAGPLRIGTGHYENDPIERKIARVLIWDRALSDTEIAHVQAWVQETYGLAC